MKNLSLSSFAIALLCLGGTASAQQSTAPQDGRVISVMIMENILFSGISDNNPVALLDKKIARVDQSMTDPLQKDSDTNAELARKEALLRIKSRLMDEKMKLHTLKAN